MLAHICGSSLADPNSPSYALNVRRRSGVGAVNLVRSQGRVTLIVEVERNTPILLIADAGARHRIVTVDGLITEI